MGIEGGFNPNEVKRYVNGLKNFPKDIAFILSKASNDTAKEGKEILYKEADKVSIIRRPNYVKRGFYYDRSNKQNIFTKGTTLTSRHDILNTMNKGGYYKKSNNKKIAIPDVQARVSNSINKVKKKKTLIHNMTKIIKVANIRTGMAQARRRKIDYVMFKGIIYKMPSGRKGKLIRLYNVRYNRVKLKNTSWYSNTVKKLKPLYEANIMVNMKKYIKELQW